MQASDVDVFRFTVVTPGLYVFYTRGSTDTTGRLLDGAATQLDIDADSGEALNMRFEKQLAALDREDLKDLHRVLAKLTVHASADDRSTVRGRPE